jgi:hypothetical protein
MCKADKPVRSPSHLAVDLGSEHDLPVGRPLRSHRPTIPSCREPDAAVDVGRVHEVNPRARAASSSEARALIHELTEVHRTEAELLTKARAAELHVVHDCYADKAGELAGDSDDVLALREREAPAAS